MKAYRTQIAFSIFGAQGMDLSEIQESDPDKGCRDPYYAFPMVAQVGSNRVTSAAPVVWAGVAFLRSMTLHVRLQRAWAGKVFIAFLALVPLLGACYHHRVDLTHN